MRLFLAFIFLASSAHAAVDVKLKDIEFRYDETLGTFDKGGGEIRGYITGFNFQIEATDTVTGEICRDGGFYKYPIPLTSFPTKQDTITLITGASKSSGFTQRIRKCLDTRERLSREERNREKDKFQGIDGTGL